MTGAFNTLALLTRPLFWFLGLFVPQQKSAAELIAYADSPLCKQYTREFLDRLAREEARSKPTAPIAAPLP